MIGNTVVDTISASYISAYVPANAWMEYGNITLTALFEAGNPDSTTITYAVNDPTMGTITPAPGTYTIYVGNSIIAEATPNTGYALSAWVFDTYLNGTVYESDTIYSTNPAFDNPINFGTLPQSYADYNATITITALFEASTPTQYLTVHLTTNNTTLGVQAPYQYGNDIVGQREVAFRFVVLIATFFQHLIERLDGIAQITEDENHQLRGH